MLNDHYCRKEPKWQRVALGLGVRRMAAVAAREGVSFD